MKKRSIDIIRLIATYLVVAIHISPFEKINPSFDLFFTRILGRLAVPLFFMITGYYILSKSLKDIEVLKEYTKKILFIYLICILIYLPINLYTGSWQSRCMCRRWFGYRCHPVYTRSLQSSRHGVCLFRCRQRLLRRIRPNKAIP